MSAEGGSGGVLFQPARDRVFLLYHEVQQVRSEYSYAVDSTSFGEHLRMLARVKRDMPSAYFPEITFDDGHRSNYELALPMLEEHGLKATFFITAGWTEQKAGYMTWREVYALHQAGHLIGAHGWTHRLLTHCRATELDEELRRSRLSLEDRLGVAVTTMSLPGGRSNSGVLRACEEYGYTQVFTSEPKAERDAHSTTLGRLNLHGSRTTEWVERVMDPKSGLLRALRLQYRIKAAAQAVAGDALYGKVWALLNREQAEPSEAGGR